MPKHPEKFVKGETYYRVENFVSSKSVLRVERAVEVSSDGSVAALELLSEHPAFNVGEVCYGQKPSWVYVCARDAWRAEWERASESIHQHQLAIAHERKCKVESNSALCRTYDSDDKYEKI